MLDLPPQVIEFPVGILPPNWLDGATFEGQEGCNGFQCNRWEKADFITYWADANSGVPVKWVFHTDGAVFYVMSFVPGEQFPAEELQAPSYCFDSSDPDASPVLQVV